MSNDRRTLLKRKAHRALVSAFAKLLARPRVTVIDVEMFWPPDHDVIHFRAEADNRDVGWDFSIPTYHWRLATDSSDEFPDELYAEIKHLFRAAWKEARAKAVGLRAYLRFHDSTSSIDLNTGREIWDRDRPDYVEPERKPFDKKGRSTKKSPRNVELVRRGDPLSKIKKAYGVSEDPVPMPFAEKSQYSWPEQGIRMEIEKGKLLWQYDVDGFMSVGFDRDDRVRSIGRLPANQLLPPDRPSGVRIRWGASSLSECCGTSRLGSKCVAPDAGDVGGNDVHEFFVPRLVR
jgi:hypothetical protein